MGLKSDAVSFSSLAFSLFGGRSCNVILIFRLDSVSARPKLQISPTTIKITTVQRSSRFPKIQIMEVSSDAQ